MQRATTVNGLRELSLNDHVYVYSQVPAAKSLQSKTLNPGTIALLDSKAVCCSTQDIPTSHCVPYVRGPTYQWSLYYCLELSHRTGCRRAPCRPCTESMGAAAPTSSSTTSRLLLLGTRHNFRSDSGTAHPQTLRWTSHGVQLPNFDTRALNSELSQNRRALAAALLSWVEEGRSSQKVLIQI